MSASNSTMKTLRALLSELRQASSQKSLRDNLAVRYVISQYRKFAVTDEQACKAKDEANFIANTYLCYLRSTRFHDEIRTQFHGKGERSIEETAKIVGFKLPHEPK